MKIKILEYGDARWDQVATYAKNCSFQGSGTYLAELMTAGAFSDFEKVFCAYEGDSIIGFCTISKESCVENDIHYPWLDFLFVDELYRKQGIGRQLVNAVIMYARSLDFNELFLCTASHEDMYHKFGFMTLYEVNINECTKGKVMKMVLSDENRIS